MDSNSEIINRFYTAFQSKNAEGMVKFYANNITFEDPAFGKLNGEDAKNMWRMLCANSSDLELEFQITSSNGNQVTAHWEAKYTFSKTGRKVHNKIDATFFIANNEIISHVDQFDLWSWSQQAMGLTGFLLGWSDFFRKKLQKTTHQTLAKYTSKS
tara:strand:+ start:166562 stop:167029 length:468 start_codon:yes stop_codon:yes gene_type:complete